MMCSYCRPASSTTGSPSSKNGHERALNVGLVDFASLPLVPVLAPRPLAAVLMELVIHLAARLPLAVKRFLRDAVEPPTSAEASGALLAISTISAACRVTCRGGHFHPKPPSQQLLPLRQEVRVELIGGLPATLALADDPIIDPTLRVLVRHDSGRNPGPGDARSAELRCAREPSWQRGLPGARSRKWPQKCKLCSGRTSDAVRDSQKR